ncbi:tRNA (uracil(54)-C(5))-methyltransferase homolog [Pollicipes pollicipes]|uniref:tRNA (uracil(54)-C(5))-methyltransferase homolog n=1 Tax=Pollicipes pollicipes TaxID=41117 RepID=UPI0018856EE0|nr:tRNA (uracil(54)-C(5))-methyltransferase homolog [Pollicipes pollicipes]
MEEGIGAAARFWGVAPHEAHERAADTPQVDGYRNKEEYKIGEGVDGDPKTVGFIFSSPAHGPALCLPGDRLKNCKPQHARLALPSRQSARGCASISPSGLGAACGLHSLLFQECPHARCSAEQAPYQSLFGPGVLEDRLGPVRFLVSPDSFFQVNCAAAEVLYGVVRRQARLTPASVLLDLCSGTGPVSLLMARHCRTCVGIEASRSAVRDANENAAMNNIQNVEFIAGRIEKELSPVVADLDLCSDMVAVVNPGRDGVAPPVVEQLRAAAPLRRLIYIRLQAGPPAHGGQLGSALSAGWTGAAFPVDTRRARRSVPAHGPSGAGADLREVVSVLT